MTEEELQSRHQSIVNKNITNRLGELQVANAALEASVEILTEANGELGRRVAELEQQLSRMAERIEQGDG